MDDNVHSVSTIDELDDLPEDAVVLTPEKVAWQKDLGEWFEASSYELGVSSQRLAELVEAGQHLTVLYVPGEDSRG